MPKIVLDPKESGMELFFKLFFSATRKLGLSDKEACLEFRKSVEAIENAPAEERWPDMVQLNISSCEWKQ